VFASGEALLHDFAFHIISTYRRMRRRAKKCCLAQTATDRIADKNHNSDQKSAFRVAFVAGTAPQGSHILDELPRIVKQQNKFRQSFNAPICISK